MKVIKYIIILITFLGFINESRCWKAILDRAEVLKQNNEIVALNFTVLKINRTTFAANVFVNLFIDLPRTAWIQIKMHGGYSNTYRELPFLVKRPICSVFDNEFKFIKDEIQGHFPTKCPVKKGLYYMKNFIPDANHLPENPWKINKYILEFLFIYKEKIQVQLKVYFHATNVDEYYKE